MLGAGAQEREIAAPAPPHVRRRRGARWVRPLFAFAARLVSARRGSPGPALASATASKPQTRQLWAAKP
jgi:hypothetical protein